MVNPTKMDPKAHYFFVHVLKLKTTALETMKTETPGPLDWHRVYSPSNPDILYSDNRCILAILVLESHQPDASDLEMTGPSLV